MSRMIMEMVCIPSSIDSPRAQTSYDTEMLDNPRAETSKDTGMHPANVDDHVKSHTPQNHSPSETKHTLQRDKVDSNITTTH